MSMLKALMKKAKACHGGKCYACGGPINPKLQQSHMAHGGISSQVEETFDHGHETEPESEHIPDRGSYKEMQPDEHRPDWDGFRKSELPDSQDPSTDYEPGYYAFGGVDDEYNPESINDTGGDSDDLVYSPEKSAGSVDNETEDADDNGKKTSFLRAYMIHRRLKAR